MNSQSTCIIKCFPRMKRMFLPNQYAIKFVVITDLPKCIYGKNIVLNTCFNKTTLLSKTFPLTFDQIF